MSGTGRGDHPGRQMGSSAATEAHLSIAFSAEELAVLAADLGHDPRRTGVPLPGDWTRRERELALEVARRSLRSRRVLTDGPGGPEMAYAVSVLVDLICAPAARISVYRGGTVVRFLAQPDATVRHEHHDGLHRFTPLATVELVRWIAADGGLAGADPGAADVSGTTVELPASAYLEVRRALRAGDLASAEKLLAAQHAPEGVLAALSNPSAECALSVRRPTATGTATVIGGGELAWVDAGDAGVWLLPTVDQPVAGPGAQESPGTGSPVHVTRTTRAAVVDEIVGFLRDDA